MTELLSPAGGREALAAAVQNGADAVYMGFGSFNARRSARNFSDEEFLAAVRYCHLRGVKVYLTLNTLVTDRELPALAETARRASEYGVDAILVQDWGVYETLRAVIPDVPLHASTQMALHTLSGVEEAARLGMTRAVLARELSGEEIREIAERAPIEIETFAHGALRLGEPMVLTAEDGDGHCVTVTGVAPEAARSRAVTAGEVEARLRKTGGTAFTVSDCAVTAEDGLSVPASALNALRRDALAALAAMRTEIPERREGTFVPAERIKNPTEPPRFTVSIYRAGQLTDALVNEGVETVYVPLELLPSVEVEKYRGRTKFAAVLPRVWRTADEEGLREQLRTAKERGVKCAVLGNLGHFALVRGLDMELRGDFGLNVFNSAALRFLREQGLSGATLSFELRHEQLRDISKCIPCEAIVYGRLPLMITENCIVANEFGCRRFKGRCGAVCADSACAGAPELTDRVGERFPVLHAYGCRSELQNGKTLWLADKPEYRKIGLTYARLRFTTESAEECVRVLRAYKGREEYTPKDITRGLFYRGVE